MIKLTKDQIKQIDDYLIKLKVKYIDVRLELIDHLASDFEQSSQYVLLEDYLDIKVAFILNFQKKRQKTIHWNYQKLLWKRFSMFFYKLEHIAFILSLIGLVFILNNLLAKKTTSIILIVTIGLIYITSLFTHFSKEKRFKKFQNTNSIMAIMAFPSLFLFMFQFSCSIIYDHLYLLFGYLIVGVLFNTAGFIEVYNQKQNLLKAYSKIV